MEKWISDAAPWTGLRDPPDGEDIVQGDPAQDDPTQDDSGRDRGDSVEGFVRDLRGLRDGFEVPPTWDAMVHRAKVRGVRVGKSTLHKIAKLDALPSELAVRGYVTSLGAGAEVDRWLARRAALVDSTATGHDTDHDTDHGAAHGTERSGARLRGRPGWRWWVAAAVVVLGTNVVTGFVVRGVSSPQPSPQQNSSLATTGDNPLDTTCVDDAKIAASTNKTPQFLLEIVFSARCRAFWARITRSDDRALGNHVEVALFRRSDPGGSSRQDAVEPDVKSAFTTLVVRGDPTDRLCATGAILTDGVRVPAVEPLCI